MRKKAYITALILIAAMVVSGCGTNFKRNGARKDSSRQCDTITKRGFAGVSVLSREGNGG